MFVTMKNISVLMLCVVFVCVSSECDNTECVDEVVKDILNDQSIVEDIDLKAEVPNFKQVRDIQDLNQILQSLTGWFGDKLNETNFLFKHVNNKTKIFVKTFDFKVDFEKGNANIGLSLGGEDQSENADGIIFNDTTTTTIKEKISTTVNPVKETRKTASKISNTIENNIDTLIDNQNGEDVNDIYKTIDFDSTYYDDSEDNSTDYPIIDYIELYKDTTNEEYVYTGTELPTTLADFLDSSNDTESYTFGNTTETDGICNGDAACESFTKAVFPWVAAIFIKNDSENSQFNYICDGALVSENIILTDGRCMLMANETVKTENVLVFLGKGNLQSMASTEELHRISMVKLHPNFTREGDEKPLNDLALLTMEQPATISESIQSACINPGEEEELEEAATTAWGPNGQLLPIFFEKEKSDICFDKNEDIFCATYGLQVALCPSYGGLYAAKRASTWCLQGVFYGDTADRGLCFNRNVLFTSLNKYIDWIDDVVEINKLNIH